MARHHRSLTNSVFALRARNGGRDPDWGGMDRNVPVLCDPQPYLQLGIRFWFFVQGTSRGRRFAFSSLNHWVGAGDMIILRGMIPHEFIKPQDR